MIFGGDTPAKKLQECRELPTAFLAPDLVDLLHGLRVVRRITDGDGFRRSHHEGLAFLHPSRHMLELGIIHIRTLLHGPQKTRIATQGHLHQG